MFATFFAGASFWALLFWRCLTYYAFIIQGISIILYDAIIGNKKNKVRLEVLKQKYPDYYRQGNSDMEHLEIDSMEDFEKEMDKFETKEQIEIKENEKIE